MSIHTNTHTTLCIHTTTSLVHTHKRTVCLSLSVSLYDICLYNSLSGSLSLSLPLSLTDALSLSLTLSPSLSLSVSLSIVVSHSLTLSLTLILSVTLSLSLSPFLSLSLALSHSLSLSHSISLSLPTHTCEILTAIFCRCVIRQRTILCNLHQYQKIRDVQRPASNRIDTQKH